MTTTHKFSPQAVQVLRKRYMLKDDQGTPIETVEGVFRRVADAVASAEMAYNGNDSEATAAVADEFYRAMMDQEFFPNSPCIANAGRGGTQQQLSACFVLPVEDSLDKIFERVKNTALIHKTGGGTGFSFGRLRPKDSIVASTGHAASGPVSFMGVFDAATEAIKQGGMRRGANMGILPVNHPDILEFIHCKDKGDYALNFNISVGITADFMRALKGQGVNQANLYEYALTHPKTGITTWLDAREVFTDIAKSAWATGDPGVVFLDRINDSRSAPIPSLGPIESTNPCLTGDTMIATVYEGAKSFKELADRGTDVLVYAWSPETKKPVVRWMRKPRLTRRAAEVWTVEFDSGLKVRCTPDHHFFTFRGQKIQAHDLQVGQSVRAFSTSIHRDGHIRAHGWDGEENKANHQWLARMVWECEEGEIPDRLVVHHKNHNQLDNRIENLELIDPIEHNRHHYPKRHAHGFRGHEDFPAVLEKARTRQLEAAAVNHKVVAIYPSGTSDVYNGTVDDVHTYIIVDPEFHDADGLAFTGIVSKNCGEQPLEPFNACTLGSINLAQFVTPGKMHIDFQRLAAVVRLGIRFLDNTLDVNHYPMPKIEDMVKKTRRIGLGIMGWHDVLIKLRIPYCSDAALHLAASIGEFIRYHADEMSRELGRVRGAFPMWQESIYNGGIAGGEVFNPRAWAGLRNCARTTIAPTGTISIFAGASSGIEPVFAWEFEHHGLEGDLKGQIFRHPLYVQAKEEGWYDNELFLSALEIDPKWHLAHQKAWQKWIDNATSKTVNMPKTATWEQVRDIYLDAYEGGCMGVTIFRTGCRDSQVLNTVGEDHAGRVVEGQDSTVAEQVVLDEDEFDELEEMSEPRPYVLPGWFYKQQTPFGNAFIGISEKRGQPYELFSYIGKAGSDTQAMAEAASRIASKWMRTTPLQDRRWVLSEVADQFDGIGGTMTSGFGPNKVRSIPDGVSKVIKHYLGNKFIEDQAEVWKAIDEQPEPDLTPHNPPFSATPTLSGELCPQCSSFTVHRMEGCKKCIACDYSEC